MRATKIRVANGRLYLSWEDEQNSSVGLEYLRDECPCADCKGEPVMLKDNRPKKIKIDNPSKYIIKAIHPVGTYAINVWWADGHKSGIYTWEYLRQLAEDEAEGTNHEYKPLI